MKNVIVSSSEKHPIVGREITIDPADRRVLIVFGLAKRRGDNIVSSTRYTDPMATVLASYNLTLYQIPEADPVMPQEQDRDRMASQGVRADFVGLAYNVRRTWGQEKYKTFLSELYEAMA